jgi:hypothetical protein
MDLRQLDQQAGKDIITTGSRINNSLAEGDYQKSIFIYMEGYHGSS